MTIKIGMIGAGAISNYHLEAYRKLEDVELVAIADINRDRAKIIAKKFNIPKVFDQYEEMLQKVELDGVSVTTWNNTHANASIAALNAGVNVLCEKPPAMNAKETQNMQEIAKKTGKLMMVGFTKRFSTKIDLAMKYVKSGYFGDFYHAKAICLRRCGNPGGWFADISKSGGGPIIDLAVHYVDLVWYLMRKPKAVSVSAATYTNLGLRSNIKGDYIKGIFRYKSADYNLNGLSTVEDLGTGFIRFNNGATLFVEVSYSQHIDTDYTALELYGTKAGISLEPTIRLATEKFDHIVDELPNVEGDTFQLGFDREIAHFINCIQGKQSCLTPIEDGVEIMKILDAIYESARLNKEILL